MPDTGLGYRLGLIAAETRGVFTAAAVAGRDAIEGLGALAQSPPPLLRLTALMGKAARGELSAVEAAEAAELEAMRRATIAAVRALFPNDPTVEAYRVAVSARPGLVDAAYRRGLATEADVVQAYEERGFVPASLILPYVSAAAMLKQLGAWRGRRLEDASAGRILARPVEDTARLARHPSDVDWPVIDNPGIRWWAKGGGIVEQGLPWEGALAARGTLGVRTPASFKTFDFFDAASRTATSAKTLDTQTLSRIENPLTIYNTLTDYIRQVERFDSDFGRNFEIDANYIRYRRIELAVPVETSNEQIVQIKRAMDYARERDVDLQVSFVQ